VVLILFIGLLGKPSSGKTTFLNAACLTSYKTADYPFTTIEAQPGTAYVRVKCVCKELGVTDNPRNSICIDGIRYVPINMLDVAGLVPDAWRGKGLGNKFLDDLRRADALIHVVDASGTTDAEGRRVEPGTWDPLEDVRFLEREVAMWLTQIIMRDWRRLTGRVRAERIPFAELMSERLSGLKIKKEHVIIAVKNAELGSKSPDKWSEEEEIYQFALELRKVAKPMIIAANKVDLPTAPKNVERLQRELKNEYIVIPCCAAGEYALRQLAEKGIIKYRPGDPDFEILKPDKLTSKAKEKLEKLREEVLHRYGSTGVQQVLDEAVFNLLKMIAVFPVEDTSRYTDHEGNVLPDVFLLPEGSTPRDLAYKIHTELGKTFIYAVDARTGIRLGEDYKLKNRDIIKIVSTARRR